MMEATFTIEEFPVRTASDEAYAALAQFVNQMRQERLPDDPPRPVAEIVGNMQTQPPFVHMWRWAVWRRADAEAEIVALATAVYLDMEENKHIMQTAIEVLPAYRRQGWAKRLLPYLLKTAEQAERRLLVGNTYGEVSGGEAFAQRLGAEKGLEAHINQLNIADADPALLQTWQANADHEHFSLGLWIGPYPEEALDEIVALHEVMNQQPYDDLDVEEFHFTAEHLRGMETQLAANNIERWTLYAQEKATGNMAGYTEVMYLPSRPTILDQGDTGVFPQYRGHGLGKWLKAAMLEKVMQKRPSVQYIRTGNADSNAAMLKINREMGFRPYQSNTIWQIDIEKARAYLRED